MPVMNLTIDTGVINSFANYISLAAYFFPWSTVIKIVAISAALMAWRMLVSLGRTIIELIPFI